MEEEGGGEWSKYLGVFHTKNNNKNNEETVRVIFLLMTVCIYTHPLINLISQIIFLLR